MNFFYQASFYFFPTSFSFLFALSRYVLFSFILLVFSVPQSFRITWYACLCHFLLSVHFSASLSPVSVASRVSQYSLGIRRSIKDVGKKAYRDQHSRPTYNYYECLRNLLPRPSHPSLNCCPTVYVLQTGNKKMESGLHYAEINVHGFNGELQPTTES